MQLKDNFSNIYALNNFQDFLTDTQKLDHKMVVMKTFDFSVVRRSLSQPRPLPECICVVSINIRTEHPFVLTETLISHNNWISAMLGLFRVHCFFVNTLELKLCFTNCTIFYQIGV